MSPSAISTTTDYGSSSGEQRSEVIDGNLFFNGEMNRMDLNSHSDRISNNHDVSAIDSASDSTTNEPLDLVCIGFGPASLAIAIALHDRTTTTAAASGTQAPRALFLEKQERFAWHAGMQLPGAHMQISFLKDLATPRNPRSHFTFINYLFTQGRLNHFINLSTFLPSRMEYGDYLRWCAAHFETTGCVRYGTEVESVRAADHDAAGRITSWLITARNTSGKVVKCRARHVVVAVGGRPVIPSQLQGLKNVAHSSQFATTIVKIEENERLAATEVAAATATGATGRRLMFAVVGNGQSAAEIFNDLWSRFPDADIRLIIRGAGLRPSDDSPFVNEIFDPDRVDTFYAQTASERAASLALDRSTNYGVVRLSLLEHLYEKLYMQRVRHNSPHDWRVHILTHRAIVDASQSPSGNGIMLRLAEQQQREHEQEHDSELEHLDVDYIFAATGYVRNSHEHMLADLRHLLPSFARISNASFPIARDYRVIFDGQSVDCARAGVWLQGCNEKTHGLSDTLLSILAIRAGELVDSIFGAGDVTVES